MFSAIGALLSGTLIAQPARADAEADGLDTIVVTATKRALDLQDVPSSIVAFSGETLEQRQIEDLNDLSRISPGIFFNGTGYRQSSGVSLRGSTTAGDSSGVDSGVAAYVDEIPTIGTSELRTNFFDLDRIEVLRGPQGTLFGRNVTGGLISIHTRRPSFDPEMRLLLGYGNYQDYRAEAFATGPLSDTVAAKLAVSASGHKGYLKNVAVGGREGDTDNVSGRAQLLFNFNEDVSLLLGGEFYHEEGDTASAQFFGSVQPNLVVLPGGTMAAPGGTPGGTPYPTLSFDPDHSNNGLPGTGKQFGYSFLARLEANLGFAELTSVTGYRSAHPEDSDSNKLGLPAPVISYGVLRESLEEKSEQFSQELRLSSPSDQKFRWILGGFYLTSSRHQDRSTFVGYFPRQFYVNDTKLDSYAIFGEIEYDILPGLTVTIGGRQSWESRSGTNTFPLTLLIFPPVVTSTFSGIFDSFTPKFGLDYKLSEDVLIYATVSKGFKSGGFDNNVAFPIDPADPFGPQFTPPYPPETAWNYEAGVKATLLDRRLQANLSIFRQDYNNLQRRVFQVAPTAINPCGLCYIVQPVPKARAQGIELEVAAKPVDWLTVGGSWAYLDTEIREANAADPASQGTPLPAHKHSANIYGEASWLVDNIGRISLGGDVTFRSRRPFGGFTTADPPQLKPLSKVKGILNLHASLGSAGDAWTLTLWGKNVTNHRYLINGGGGLAPLFGLPADAELFSVNWNQPRTYGFTLSFRM